MSFNCNQFIDNRVIEIVRVGIGEREIRASRHEDFCDLSFRQWELVAPALERYIGPVVKAAGLSVTFSLLLQVQKEAARLIRAEKRS